MESIENRANDSPGIRWWLILLIVIVVAPIMWFFLMPHGGTPIEFINEQKCKVHLKQIGLGCFMYAVEHDGPFPFSEDGSFASLALLYPKDVEQAKLFTCPEELPAKGQRTPIDTLRESQCSYTYLPGLLAIPLRDDAPADLIVAYDKEMLHKREKMSGSTGGRIVLYADGHVERVTEPEFQEQLAQCKAKYAKQIAAPVETPARTTALKLESDAKAVIVGGRQQLRVLAVTDGGTIDRTKDCQYHSSDEKVADLLPGGIVRGKWSGKVTITATLDGVRSDALELQVLHAPPPMPK